MWEHANPMCLPSRLPVSGTLKLIENEAEVRQPSNLFHVDASGINQVHRPWSWPQFFNFFFAMNMSHKRPASEALDDGRRVSRIFKRIATPQSCHGSSTSTPLTTQAPQSSGLSTSKEAQGTSDQNPEPTLPSTREPSNRIYTA